MIANVRDELIAFSQRLLPRMLTHACRDPGSEYYGCFDRDWWHYKIRDFVSMVLQQGGYAVYCAERAGLFRGQGDPMPLVAASCRFWNARAKLHGAFEEYYPFEQGYPPLAFSTLAVAKLCAAGVVEKAEIADGLEIASRQLLARFEGQAANQQVAGLAALSWLGKVDASLAPAKQFQEISQRTLALQSPEGWFREYGGPDLGYLAVTMDCLWDLFDATGDQRYVSSAESALKYISAFTQLPWRGAGLHNARNTDYILPYGISRFIRERHVLAPLAGSVLVETWGNLKSPDHFAHAIDDRYWNHYAGHSVMRAIQVLEEIELPVETNRCKPAVFRESGHVISPAGGRGKTAVLVSGNKGGILNAWCGDAKLADFGWVLQSESGQQWVTHWWADFWKWDGCETGAKVSGFATRHGDALSTPWRHMALRLMSFAVGRRLITMLKKKLIFKPQKAQIAFERQITWGEGRITVEDRFSGVPAGLKLQRAPRSSKRHVASADSFQHEDLQMVNGWKREEQIEQVSGGCNIKTVYTVVG